MPRGRKKRHDPADAPIDGDYAMDVVLNRDPAKIYAWLSKEDIPKFKARGYSRIDRSTEEGSARSAFDLGDPTDAGYRNGDLELYAVPREIKERIDRHAQRAQDDRMATIDGPMNGRELRRNSETIV